MKQHPIPQNILDIEFKLFTKFTVKEFTYIAVGVGFGGIFLYMFSLKIVPFYLAIPAFIILSGIGLFLGLVPINDQKADVFMSNYFRAIKRPTQRVWRNKSFDEKVELEATERGLSLTQGTLERTPDKQGKAKIIGGSDTTSSNQFVEQQVIDNLDLEEDALMQQFESLASIDTNLSDLPQNSFVQQPQTETPISTEAPIEEAQFQELSLQQPQPEFVQAVQSNVEMQDVSIDQTQQAPLTPQAPVIEQVQPVSTTPPVVAPMTSNTSTITNTTITITKESANSYAIEIEGLQLLPNSINLQLTDKNSAPVAQATIMVKDSNGGIIQVLQSNIDGLVISNKSYPQGQLQLEIHHDQYTFPKVYYILEGETYPALRISAI